jgi:hypothetical protein
MREAQLKMHLLLHPSEIVDMTPTPISMTRLSKFQSAKLEETNICTAAAAAVMVDNILSALAQMLSPTDNCSDSKTLFAVDENIWNLFRIQIPLRSFQPHEMLKTSAGKAAVFADGGIRALQAALQLTVESNTFKLSLEQYFALLEIYGNTPEVLTVVQKHFGDSTSNVANSHRDIVEEVRSGCRISPFLNACSQSLTAEQDVPVINGMRELLLHPTAAYVQQLHLFLKYSAPVAVNECANSGENPISTVMRRRRAAETAIRVVREAIKLRGQAKMAMEIGDTGRAVRYITAALEGTGGKLLAEDADTHAEPDINRKSKSKPSRTKKVGKKTRKKRSLDSGFEEMFEYYMSGEFGSTHNDDDEDVEHGDTDDDDEDVENDDYDEDVDGSHSDDDSDDDNDEDFDDLHNGSDDGGRNGLEERGIPFSGFRGLGEDMDFHDDHVDHDENGEATDGRHSNFEEFESDLMSDLLDTLGGLSEPDDTGAKEDVFSSREMDSRVDRDGLAISQESCVGSRATDIDAIAQERVVADSGTPRSADGTEMSTPIGGAASDSSRVENVAPIIRDSCLDNRALPSSANAGSSVDVAAADFVAGSDESELCVEGFNADVFAEEIEPHRLLPVQLKTSLLGIRAQLYCELGELQNALKDCSLCIELDSRNAKIYGLRSQILNSYLAEELIADNEGSETKKRQELLIESAKDALSGKF